MPASRPRISSGIVWFQIVPRKIPLIMSARPGQREEERRAARRSAPARPARSPRRRHEPPRTIARPWWWTRVVQPLVAVASTLPTVSAV